MSLESILHKLDNFEKFAGEYRESSNGFILGNHQLVPIFDVIENDLRRFMLVYGTGAGKTVIPMEIIKQLRTRGQNPKVLIMAPKNTLLDKSIRDEINRLEDSGIKVHRIEGRKDIKIPEDSDTVVINYEKLNPRLGYLKNLVNYARKVDLVIADEFQDVRNKDAVCSKGYQEIIIASKDARLIGLSASPIYNTLTDAGMMLFTLNPEFRKKGEGYGHYKDITFNIDEDRGALFEMREKGNIRFFNKEDVARFHDLAEFIEHEPIQIKMPKKYIQGYFEIYKGIFHAGQKIGMERLISLERIAINSILESEDTKEFLREQIKKGYVLNFFSHLMHEPKQGTPDEAIFRRLENLVRELGAKNMQTIRGLTSEKMRKEIQKMMNAGELDALINQWKCTSQGFSEIAGNRPVFIIPLRSPYAPGRHLQIIGRSWRPGQKAPVEYIELHAHSDELLEMIDSYVRDYARENNVKIKSTWEASLFHADACKVRKSKENQIFLFFTSKVAGMLNKEIIEISSLSDYAQMLSKERIIDYSERGRLDFGTGTRAVVRYVGKSYEDGLKENIEPLGRDYNKQDVLFYTPGIINIFLAKVIEKIKEREKTKEESWRIADLGSCSSSVFAQARLFYQSLESIKNKIDLDHIVNIDGNSGLIKTAREFLESKDWLNAIREIEMPRYNKEEISEAINKLRKLDYMKNLEFLVLNFTKERIPGLHDVIITSQCLQYNDQENERDIEKIVRNVNHSLRHRGHYLAVLTGNSWHKSSTSDKDVENFKLILNSYGFKVEKCEHIAGEGEKEIPFHYIHAIKIDDAPSDLVSFQTIPIVYSNTVEYLTGGHKKISFRASTIRQTKPSKKMPPSYFNEKGEKFVF